MKLRKAHYTQLQDYINVREREGWYYGNKAHYEKRHAELKEWINNQLKRS
ncbi:MAG: hypothetical protein GY861_13760 [bacterium]|nr:hypothetical protein [bacterium]